MKKNSTITIALVIVVAGLVCGPATLEAAHAARPPFDWGSVILCFFGLLFGLPYVIGIQLVRSDPKYAQFAISGFGPISVFIASSGFSAFVIGLIREGLTPQSAFFFCGGIAMLIAVGICKVLCHIKVAKHEYQMALKENPNQEMKADGK